MKQFFNVIESPFGPLSSVVDAECQVKAIHFGALNETDGRVRSEELTRQVDRQLHEYLRKERTQFDLPLAPTGSEFQNQVWSLLLKIPYGSTCTYGELAAELGHTGAARAVGRANATNPIAIIIPCHRVIGSSGSLTGYAGGLDMKEKLLQFEMGLTPSLFD
jgi:methylated-DNA-[protein]-cysteine S-methyltransferase